MSFFRWVADRFKGQATDITAGSQVSYPANWLPSQQNINEDLALQLAVVYRCVELTANAVSGSNIQIFEQKNGIKTPANTELQDLLDRPNIALGMSSHDFLSTLILNLKLHGNFYAHIVRNAVGNPVSLWVLPSTATTPELVSEGGFQKLQYRVRTDTQLEGESERVYDAEDVFHIRGMGNGLVGLSPIAYASRTIGIGIQTDKFIGDWYENGGRPGGVLSTEQTLTAEQRQLLTSSLVEQMQNATASHRTIMLEAGFKYQPIQMSPNDLMTLEARKYGVEDISRIFGVPLALLNIGDHTKARAENTEDIINQWVSTDLKQIFQKIETEIKYKLMNRRERKRYDVEFDKNGMIAYNLSTLSNIAVASVTAGVLTQNEARELLGKPRREDAGADELRQQQQMVSGSQQDQTTEEATDGN